jgi:diacylglycerol kinase (ATP)
VTVGSDVWLVANPAAGGGRGARHASMAAKSIRDAGVDCRLVQPVSAADATDTARRAAESGAAAVVACGGDGTVHAVLQGLVGTDTPLGIVAGGSGDDIATGLGLATASPAAAARQIIESLAHGRIRNIDVAEATTADGTRRFFLGVMSTGFDSSVNERANRMSRLGGQRYNIAIVRELASFKPLDYRVEIDGVELVEPGMLVSVGNGPQYGGGMRVCPFAEPDDGELDVTWLGALSRPAFLRVFPTVFTGEHVHHPAVHTYRGKSLRIEAAGQMAYADGERIGPLPVTVQVRPRVLRVLTG